jgi:hypothetical protein
LAGRREERRSRQQCNPRHRRVVGHAFALEVPLRSVRIDDALTTLPATRPVGESIPASFKSLAKARRHFGCDVHFDAPLDLLVFDERALAEPFVTHNEDLLEVMLPGLEAKLSARTFRTFLRELSSRRWTPRRPRGVERPEETADDHLQFARSSVKTTGFGIWSTAPAT